MCIQQLVEGGRVVARVVEDSIRCRRGVVGELVGLR